MSLEILCVYTVYRLLLPFETLVRCLTSVDVADDAYSDLGWRLAVSC